MATDARIVLLTNPTNQGVEMFTKILCGECGGEYRRSEAFTYTCTECDHSVTQFDVVLDEGETLAALGGVLGYLTEEVA